MKIRRFSREHRHSRMAVAVASVALALSAASSLRAQAQTDLTPDQQSKAETLLKQVRDATERFKDVEVAKSEGYKLLFGCVSGESSGAMGLHYVNMKLVGEGVLNVNTPQIIIYEPTSSGHLRITGADYLLPKAPWDKKHNKQPPELMGQLFHLFDAPNRFGLDPFYTLHVWAWKDNPNGAFVNWHPSVSCKLYNGEE